MDDESSQSTQEKEWEDDELKDDTNENIHTTEYEPEPNFNYLEFATSLLQNGNINSQFSVQEENLINSSSVNAQKYGKTQSGIERRFFDTIHQYALHNYKLYWKKLKEKESKIRGFILC